MYLNQNGNQVPVVFGTGDSTQSASDTDSSSTVVGANKTWLYVALIIAIIAVIVSGYLLYQQHKKQNSNKVGYQLY